MPFLRRFRQRPASAQAAPRKKLNLYLVAGLGFFLLGLFCSVYWTFPGEILRQRLVHELEARLPLKVTLAEADLRPLLTVTGKQLSVGLPDQPGTLFQVDTFQVDPHWTSLFTGELGVEGDLSVLAGELSFRWQRSGPLELSGQKLSLDLPLATSPATRFSGILTTGRVTTAAPLQKTTESRIDLTFEQVAVQGLEDLVSNAAGLRLGTISLQMTGQGTAFSIARLEMTGGDLELSAEGTLMLATAKPQNSRINLNLSVRAGKQADPILVSLLELAGTPQSDGSRKLRLTGTLDKPVFR